MSRSELPQNNTSSAGWGLADSKGFDVLIEAFRAADLPDARLVIFGEGRERRRLERLLGPNMTMPGFRKSIKDYYQAFDLFVCPSRRDHCPSSCWKPWTRACPWLPLRPTAAES